MKLRAPYPIQHNGALALTGIPHSLLCCNASLDLARVSTLPYPNVPLSTKTLSNAGHSRTRTIVRMHASRGRMAAASASLARLAFARRRVSNADKISVGILDPHESVK